jgi:hypothetical protein
VWQNEEIGRLNVRIAELEAESLKKSVKEWANKDKEKIDALEAHIAELEAAQQWHPASEPPEDESKEYLLLNQDCISGEYWCEVDRFSMRNPDCIDWCELPPMPEKETR